jgi:hypothetical protein
VVRPTLLVPAPTTHTHTHIHLPACPPACLPAALLNVFGVFIGLEKDDSRTFAALAQTDCLLYTWSLAELNTMATQLAPAGGRTLSWLLIACLCGFGE